MSLSATKVGIRVTCVVCGNQKKPRGRSAPLGTYYCESLWDDYGCEGYEQDPKPGSLWPGESEAEFGYPVGTAGTRESAIPAAPTDRRMA